MRARLALRRRRTLKVQDRFHLSKNSSTLIVLPKFKGPSLPNSRQQPTERGAAGGNDSKNYLILPARSVIFVLMLVPRVWKATTQANATSAAATAYSESSRPVSSAKNFLIILFAPLDSIRRCCSNEWTNEGGCHLLFSLSKVEQLWGCD